MARAPKDRKGSVEKLKDELYSRKNPPKTDPNARTPLRKKREHTQHTWEDIHLIPKDVVEGETA
ncbi:MAG: hypothetical protein ACREGH_03040, partial [Minisyncoccia bacterium]